MKHIFARTIVTASLLTLTLSAFSQAWYFGAGYGCTRIQTNSDRFLNSPNVNKWNRGGKGFVGYMFNDNFAIEGAYMQFGRFNINADANGNGSGSIRPYALGGSLVAMLPFGGFGVGASAGLYSLHYSLSPSLAYASGKTGPGNGLAYGYGAFAQYQMVKNAYLRLAWDGLIERHRGTSIRTNPGMATLDLVIAIGAENEVNDSNA